jgi:hypothetical protein
MKVDNARIYNEGVSIGPECEEKVRQIVNAVKSISPSSDLSMRFLKSGHTYEALLWGRADNIPIGVYNRGPSLSHVLETLQKKVKKECLKVWKLGHVKPRGHSPFAMAG